jgi:hypothetical protein
MNGHYPPGKGTKKSGIPQAATLKRTWTPEEKDLFLRGLEIHGRSWTKISEIIQTRTPLQVKNYAQQHFKQKAKFQQSNPPVTATISQPSQSLEGVLMSVTTAQVTTAQVTVSSPNYSKQSPVKSPVKFRGGKSPGKSKAVRTVRQIIQDEGRGREGVQGDVKILNLIACDPTVKRIEKVSDDEDVEIDVEFDEEMCVDNAAGQNVSGPADVGVGQDVSVHEQGIPVSSASSDQTNSEGQELSTPAEGRQVILVSVASSTVTVSQAVESMGEEMDSPLTAEAQKGLSIDLERVVGTSVLEETESVDIEIDEQINHGSVHCMAGSDEIKHSNPAPSVSEQVQSSDEIIFCEPTASTSADN